MTTTTELFPRLEMGERFFFFPPGVSAHLEDDRHLDKHARFQIYMTEHAQLKVLET